MAKKQCAKVTYGYTSHRTHQISTQPTARLALTAELGVLLAQLADFLLPLENVLDRREQGLRSADDTREVLLCNRYTCFLHYFALFGGLGLNR